MNCPFCKLDSKDIANTIIEETENFIIVSSKGALCDGYLLILTKEHLNSMNELSNKNKVELNSLINKYREKFYQIYRKYPIFFEHGSSGVNYKASAGSVTHAHMHVVNHNFNNEEKIIKELNLQEVNIDEFLDNKNRNYISYISPAFKHYITYDFKPTSQQMRIFIAEDLHLSNDYNWKTTNFDDNIISTIKKFTRI